MANKVLLSPQFSVKWREGLIGLFYAVGGAVLAVAETTINAGSLSFDWKKIALAAVGTGLLYIGRTFFKKPSVTTVYDSNVSAEVVANSIAEENQTVVK